MTQDKRGLNMSIFSLKLKLQRSIQVFALAIVFATAILFITMYYGTDKWILGLLPTIIVLSIIGEIALARAIVRLTALTGQIENKDGDSFEDRFAGISGLNGLLYALVPLIYCTTFICLYALKINIFDFKIVNVWVSGSLLALTSYFLYKTINQLSFALLFISIIYGWTDIAKANKVKKNIDSVVIPESVDLPTNFKKMAKKYAQRIDWLENHIDEKTKDEYQHKISIYQNVLRDIEDITNGIEL